MFPRPVVAVLLGAALTLASGEATKAHVTVEPTEGPVGGFMSYTFRMPNEKNVATTSLRLEFPTDLVVSRFMPKPGWTREVLRDANQRVVGVQWSGGNLAPDEYEEFSIVARNPRQVGSIAFKAYQGYADGSVVEWVGPPDAEEPAPVVRIVAASGPVVDAHGQLSGGSAAEAPATAGPAGGAAGSSSAVAPATGSGSDLSLFVALLSVILAAIALALAVVSLVRRPQAA